MTSTISSGQWHHVVIVVDTPISISNMTLGKSGSKYLSGTVDDVRLYNRVLSDSEVSDLYNAGAAAASNPTVTAVATPTLNTTGTYYVDSTGGSDANNGSSPDLGLENTF